MLQSLLKVINTDANNKNRATLLSSFDSSESEESVDFPGKKVSTFKYKPLQRKKHGNMFSPYVNYYYKPPDYSLNIPNPFFTENIKTNPATDLYPDYGYYTGTNTYAKNKIKSIIENRNKKRKKKNRFINKYKHKKGVEEFNYEVTDPPESYTEIISYVDYNNVTGPFPETNNRNDSDITIDGPNEAGTSPSELDLFKALLNLLSLFAVYVKNTCSQPEISNISEKESTTDNYIEVTTARLDSYEIDPEAVNYLDINYPSNEPKNPIDTEKVTKKPKKSQDKPRPTFFDLLTKKKKNQSFLDNHVKNHEHAQHYSKVEPKTDGEDYPDEQTPPNISKEDEIITRAKARSRNRKQRRERLDCDLIMECTPDCYYKCA